jgi:tRNA-specific 2-thiouridylase
LAGEDYREFLRRNAPQIGRPGPILSREGKKMGEHQGLAFYTIGQRKGLGVASPIPLYVMAKDAETNTLIIGSEQELGSCQLIAKDVNWISGEAPKGSLRAEVKTRYTAREAWAEITPLEVDQPGETFGSLRVRFDTPQRDITPGQAAVCFDGDLVLGGGTIE